MDTREHSVEITGLETFRRVVCLTSLIATAVSAIIIVCPQATCTDAPNLIDAVWITGCVQMTLFLILLLHYVHCGCLIKAIGRLMVIYYLILIGSMIWAQYIFFGAIGCGLEAFVIYYWIATNIGIFYVFVAYGLSLWGAYICWAQEEEEKIVKEAMKEQFDSLLATRAIEAEKKQQDLMIENKA